MKILWIDDDPANVVFGKTRIENRIGELSVFIPNDLKELNDSFCNVFVDYDFIIIDINLEKYFEGFTLNDKILHDNILVSHFNALKNQLIRWHNHRSIEHSYSGDEFIKEAGFAIYQNLIGLGFPRENISFYTANADLKDNTYDKYLDLFNKARLIEPNKCFIKGAAKEQDIIDWCNENDKTKYLEIRRFIIDTISKFVKHINECRYDFKNLKIFNSNSNENHELRKNELLNYLTRLIHILPLRLNRDQYHSTFIRFLRELTSPFDGVDLRDVKYEYYTSLSKNIRNWLAHNNVEGEIDCDDLLFIFDIIMYKTLALEYNLERTPTPKQFNIEKASKKLVDYYNKELIGLKESKHNSEWYDWKPTSLIFKKINTKKNTSSVFYFSFLFEGIEMFYINSSSPPKQQRLSEKGILDLGEIRIKLKFECRTLDELEADLLNRAYMKVISEKRD